VRENFDVLPGAEIAIEMHPRTSTKEFCDNLKHEGFNRISLGVQDFDEEVQKLINRHQSFEMTREMVMYLRSLGFQSFNFDLIYGLPGQTLKKFEKTLELTFALKPERLAVYSYAHVPWKSPVQRSFKDEDLPNAETKLKLYELALRAFSANDYHQVGMDHFALATDELYLALKRGGLHRNFMGYSTKADAHQIGLGISSISYVAGNYFQNAKEMAGYESAVREGRLTTIRGYELCTDDHIRRDLITEIMCHFGVDFGAFGKKHDIDAWDYFRADLSLLADLQTDGLVTINARGLNVTDSGRLVVRNVAMCFDRYLDEIRRVSKNPVFSRTV
jgi:oxygen-independent coproporphyrinogen-3 oxidase